MLHRNMLKTIFLYLLYQILFKILNTTIKLHVFEDIIKLQKVKM